MDNWVLLPNRCGCPEKYKAWSLKFSFVNVHIVVDVFECFECSELQIRVIVHFQDLASIYSSMVTKKV